MYMFMVLATSLDVLYYCCATADIFDKNFTAMLLVFHCCGYAWAIVR